MSNTSDDEIGCCAHCGAKASNACSGCEEAVYANIPHTKVLYCSPQCQSRHWIKHKTKCQNTKAQYQLTKAADLLRRLWHVFRASTFVALLDKVHAPHGGNGYITIFETRNTEDIVQPFNHGLCGSRHVAEAILSDRASGEALEYMREITHAVLINSGICSKIDEAKVYIDQARQVVICHYNTAERSRYIEDRASDPRYSLRAHAAFSSRPRSGPLEHYLYCVQLTNPRHGAYAIDFTNAQYGDFDAVVPWITFTTDHASTIESFEIFGTHDERNYMILNIAGIKYRELAEFNARRVGFLLQHWLMKAEVTILQFLALDKAEFVRRLDTLEEFVTKGLEQTQELGRKCGELTVRWSVSQDDDEKQQLLLQRVAMISQADSMVPGI